MENMKEKEKIYLLAKDLDDIYATIIRQVYFTLFEKAAYDVVKNNGTVDDLDNEYLKLLKEQLH